MSDLSSRFLRASRHLRAPGISIAWSRNGGTIETCVTGEACIGASTPVAADTCFPWFSATKLFTATAVLRLVVSGKIDLDQRLSDHVADLPTAEAGLLTPRQLLAHTSGLANPMPLRWVHLATEPAPDLVSLTFRLLVRHRKLRFEPGTRYAYSNLGYLLLGVLIERASGLGFEDYIRREILNSLSTARTGFELGPGAARGYFRTWSAMGLAARMILPRKFVGPTRGEFRELIPFQVDGAPYGGLIGPASDLAMLGRAMAASGNPGRDLLPASIVRLALEPVTAPGGKRLPIGLGWHLGEMNGEPYANHFGGGVGFRSELRIYPRLGFTVAVIANETTADTTVLTSITP